MNRAGSSGSEKEESGSGLTGRECKQKELGSVGVPLRDKRQGCWTFIVEVECSFKLELGFASSLVKGGSF